MRQTLFRIRLDDIWSLQPADGIAGVGLGYLVLLAWLGAAAWWALFVLPKTGLRREHLRSVLLGLAGGIGALLVGAMIGANSKLAWVPIYGYGFMMFLGFFSGAWLTARRARSVGIEGEAVWDMAVWIIVAGIAGARLMYIVRHSDRVFAGKTWAAKLFAVFNLPDGGLVLYGGVLLALAVFLWFCRRKGINALLMADVVIPSFFVGLAFGRLGCFLNGCCYGDPSGLPWALEFPEGSVPFRALVGRGLLDAAASATMPLHPTQLYSSLNALLLALLTAAYFRRRQRNGAVLALALCVYPVTRFLIEYLRNDELAAVWTIRRALFWGPEVARFSTPLTSSQWISISMLAAGLLFVAWLHRRPAVVTLPSMRQDSASAAA